MAPQGRLSQHPAAGDHCTTTLMRRLVHLACVCLPSSHASPDSPWRVCLPNSHTTSFTLWCVLSYRVIVPGPPRQAVSTRPSSLVACDHQETMLIFYFCTLACVLPHFSCVTSFTLGRVLPIVCASPILTRNILNPGVCVLPSGDGAWISKASCVNQPFSPTAGSLARKQHSPTALAHR